MRYKNTGNAENAGCRTRQFGKVPRREQQYKMFRW